MQQIGGKTKEFEVYNKATEELEEKVHPHNDAEAAAATDNAFVGPRRSTRVPPGPHRIAPSFEPCYTNRRLCTTSTISSSP